MRVVFDGRSALLTVIAGLALCGGVSPRGGAAEQLQQAAQRRPRPDVAGQRVYKARVQAHWFHDNTRFWYLNDLRGGAREFILVDAERGTRTAAFDHAKLAAALSKAAGTAYPADRLPFEDIEFVEEDKAIRFKVGNTTWKCDLTDYACSKVEAADGNQDSEVRGRQSEVRTLAEEEQARLESPWLGELAAEDDDPQPQPRGQRRGPEQPAPTPRSPDGKWTAFVKDHNVFLRSQEDRQEVQLSQDGKEGLAYGMLAWAPDSKTLVAFRIEPGDRKEVYRIESSPRGGGRAVLHSQPYALPGDKLTAFELNLFDVAGRKQTKPAVERVDLDRPRLHWKRDGRHFTYHKTDRGHQRFRVIEVDSHTGEARTLIDEKSQTFIWTAHVESQRWNAVNYLDKSDEIIYVSERDGWRHLYLIDAATGKLNNPITRGEYVVRAVDLIDEANRHVWFRASGRNAGQDPYFLHYYRVNFDGTGLVALTEADGNHTVEYSPDRKYLVDTYSRVDLPPVHELRRTADGRRVCELEKADISELVEGGWQPPEVLVAKGRDGKTDIWGIICRPRNFDPGKRYPVIEQIYAGPQGSFVPKSFSPFRTFASLTDLGFIVVQMDGMGTANRSKAFHDVCWHNLKDAGFPDRILWHQAVAKKYPYYDISRVGITGGSAGGQNAAAGMLFHPDFYKVAVASCGCHDNRMDKASWNEQWMGYPVGPQYSACSNIDNAARLRGKLLLIVGEMDTNVPPESTLRFADALIKAGKDFDLLVVPGAGHGSGGAYGDRRRRDFFVRHLLGVEPQDRNGAGVRRGDPPPQAPRYAAELVFPLHPKHNHAPGIVECPNGDLLVSWYRGSGERSADDVAVYGARLRAGSGQWSEPFLLADHPGFPDCNTTMFIDHRQRLWLFWPLILDNSWSSCLTCYRVAGDYQGEGPPKWSWQGLIPLKPRDFEAEMGKALEARLKAAPDLPPRTADYIARMKERLGNKLMNRLGWQPRCKPTVLPSGRILLPLYSDTYSVSLMAISDDEGATWYASKPLAGFGNIQPAVLRRGDGTLVAYMRENGPLRRIRISESTDEGITWGPVGVTEMPNPGSGLDGVRLANGHWVLVYNDTERGRNSLVVALSDDEGRSWKWRRHLERHEQGSYHYPALIQGRDGVLHAVYSYFVAGGKSMKHVALDEAWIRQGDGP
jgi:dipeptidyl aminopeptidase/acylaminoacyl peptidase/predicted neuraminidase